MHCAEVVYGNSLQSGAGELTAGQLRRGELPRVAGFREVPCETLCGEVLRERFVEGNALC